MPSSILAPVIALVLWSFVMWAWLYATRIPAITRLKIVYDPMRPNCDFNAQIPPRVRWKADNYNNLMEQRRCSMPWRSHSRSLAPATV